MICTIFSSETERPAEILMSLLVMQIETALLKSGESCNLRGGIVRGLL
jgi:hypothetical protein